MVWNVNWPSGVLQSLLENQRKAKPIGVVGIDRNRVSNIERPPMEHGSRLARHAN